MDSTLLDALEAIQEVEGMLTVIRVVWRYQIGEVLAVK